MHSNRHLIKVLPWIVWGLGAFLFFSEYVARVAPSVMTQELQLVFNTNATGIGILGAFFYYAYIAMQIPVGMLVDRYGAHRLLTVTAFLCGISSLLFATSHHLATACVARLLLGFSASFAFVGTLKLASVWFPAKRFGLLAGLSQSMGMFGAAAGLAPIAIVVTHYGWRETMVGLAVLFVLLAVLIGVIVRNHPSGYVVAKPGARAAFGMMNALKTVLQNRQTWLNGIYVGLLYAPTAAFAELWGPRFLNAVYGLGPTQAGFAVSLIYIGWIFGGPLSGWISDRLELRKPLMLFSAFAGALLLSFVLYVPHLPLMMLEIFLFLYGLTNFGVSLSYAFANEINSHRIAGTSMSFANMASVIVGSWLFMPLIGWLLDHLSVGAPLDPNGHIIYTATVFEHAMFLLPLCSLASLAFGFFLKETRCRNIETF